MLKNERQKIILDLCERDGIVTVKTIQATIHVSDMTIRRDLTEMDHEKKLIRIHGGAQSIAFNQEDSTVEKSSIETPKELSHFEKKMISTDEKKYIAKNAAQLINDERETIFLGPGTTIELMTEHITLEHVRIVTNSLPVFNLLKDKGKYDLYLVGGSYREHTGAFVGSVADEVIQKIGITKAFVGVNGIQDGWVSTFNVEEGKIQQLALDKASEKYLVADAHKFNHRDFYNFYNLKKVDGLFTDYTISESVKEQYEQYTKIFN
ncbi:DeoR/GlpR family DNA-binding transcription regulator [Enterococcus alishanensis]